jgi:Gram-negative porin
MRAALPIVVQGLCLAALPALAQDLTFTHPSGATATFYGQINLTLQNVDDGAAHYDEFVDNDNSNSRVGLWVDVPVGENELRFNLESALGLKGTSSTSQDDDLDWIDWQRTDIRKLEIAYASDFGTFWLGQGSMATDGAAEIDDSGTSVVGYVNLPDTAGSFEFRDGDDLSGVSIGDVFSDFDGGRRFRFRYDTPAFSGFVFSSAYGQEVLAEDDDADYYDVALRYSFENDAVTFNAALGYAWTDEDDETTRRLIASGSLVHLSTGLNLTLAGGDSQSDEPSYGYAKMGWRGDLVRYGETAVSVDYYDGADFETSGSNSSSWGVQAVQTVEDLSLEAYIGFRDFSYDDDTDADLQDMSALLVGARWRF